MKYIIPALLLLFAIPAQAEIPNPFGQFQMLYQNIECFRKPGTDYLVCSNKVNEAEEEEEEIEPSEPTVAADLFHQETIVAPRAHNPELDFVWTDGTKFVVDVSLIEDNLKFGNQCTEILQEIYPQDINFDEHQDFTLQLECKIDELYEGKSIMDYWKGGYIAESFIIFACGSEQGLYNCTEEFTGHEGILPMAPDSWPGALIWGEPVRLHDVNGDGVRDIFMWTTKDVAGRAELWRDDINGDEPFFDRYYDFWGKPYETCEYYRQPWYSCWFQRSVQTYAISTPEGHVVKELEWPGQFMAVHGWEMYKTGPDELHLNFDPFFNGSGIWFTWNPETQEFDYVVSHLDGQENLEEYRPVDITQDWVNADTFDRGGVKARQIDWITHNDVEYKVQARDFSKTVFVYGESDLHAQCENIIGFDYDVCDRDQIYIVSKTDQSIETFIEYRPQEIATEVRTTTKEYTPGDPGPNGYTEEYVSLLIHGYWVNYHPERSVFGKIVQLEDRPDADWYLIVSYQTQTDMFFPGEYYEPSFYSEYITEYRPGEESLYNEADIAFKYKIDFENQTLEYEGTLFEYPFIWRTVGANRYEFRDGNGDGWKDVIVKHGNVNLWHVSNIYGELQFLDLYAALPDNLRREPGDIFKDFDNDGNVDFIQMRRPSMESTGFDIDVYKTSENLWDVTPILTPWEIQDRVDNCLVYHVYDDIYYIKGTQRASECYKP